jgi:hypothetical protein
MFNFLSGGASEKAAQSNGPSTLVIKSEDIDLSKFTEENVVAMRAKYPGTYDDVLAKFLIARNNDLAKACEQYDRVLKWRAENFPVLKSSCLKEVTSGKLYVRGVDKDGRPLLIFRSRYSFPKDRDLEETSRMLVWFAEQVQRRMPSSMTKYTLLLDRTGHTSENTDTDLIKHCSAQFSVRNYVINLCNSFLYCTQSYFFPCTFLLSFRICFPTLCSVALSTHPMWCSTLFGLW